MPKIKVKNIPAVARERVCDKAPLCKECPFHLEERAMVDEDADTGCMVDSRYDPEETIVELPEQDFPTNREWLESLSDEDLAAFYTHGLLIEKYSPYPINIHQVIGSFTSSQQGIKEWLSKPCLYLIEE